MSGRKALFLVRLIYNVLLPFVLLLGVGPWVIKMLKRGGFGTGLLERVGIYKNAPDFEPLGVVYVHAVSVGEVLIALKLIATWLNEYPDDKFVIAPTTATGHAVAVAQAPEGVRVIYSPIDVPFVLRRMFARFDPKQIVLIESEVWPNLLAIADKLQIPITVGNARLSERSERRYLKLRSIMSPLFSLFTKVGVPEVADRERWQNIGVRPGVVEVTGSIKFDQSGAVKPTCRPAFQEMLDAFGEKRIVMVLSTHVGEEALIASAVQELSEDVLCVLIPRHAERRAEVKADIEALGFEVVLRSQFRTPRTASACFVVDSTGEMRDWIAHANVAIIGKSFLGKGGQNPAEAIVAGVPVITGPYMGNFEPLMSMLREVSGIICVEGGGVLTAALGELESANVEQQVARAREVLELHQGATLRTVNALRVG